MRSSLLAALLALFFAAAGACAGPSFEVGGAGAGGTAAAGGGSGVGGTGGAAGSGGASAGTGGGGSAGRGGAGRGGSAGQTGSGGLGAAGGGNAAGGGDLGGDAGASTAGASSGCSCSPGEYCRGDQCLKCADLSQLDFGTPELILDHPDRPLRFPRPGDVSNSLFFTLVSDNGGELWYEASIDAPPGGPLGDATTPGRAGLFYFDDPDNTGFNALFDEKDEGGRRSLRTTRFVGGVLTMVDNAPPPLAPGSYDDYSVALAPLTGRFYWMSTRNGSPALLTGLLGTTKVSSVDVRVAQGSCALGVDAPWVNGDGTLLVVAAPTLDANCKALDAGATDLYATPLNVSTGQPLAPAIALSGVNVSTGTSSETDAAFSNDLCTVYFASDGGSAAGFDFNLFRATRR